MTTNHETNYNINIIKNNGDIIDKINIEYADNNICYNNIKNIPLKRYTLSNNIYDLEKYKDRTILGWELTDIDTIFPKAINAEKRFLSTSQIEETDIIHPKPFNCYSSKKYSLLNVIENFKVLNEDQIYKSLYGATQKIIKDKETLEEIIRQQASTISTLQNQLNQVITWATAQGFTLTQ